MEKIEYDLDPLELDHSNHDGKNVLLAICENSEGSQVDMITSNTDEIHYEVRNSDGILQYRFLNTPSIVTTNNTNTMNTNTIISNGNNNCNNNNIVTATKPITNSTVTTTATITTQTTTSSSSSLVCNNSNNTNLSTSNCQYFLINEISPASRPCLISPKITTDIAEDKSILIGNSKKRDEKRRATHNEVERRRRDKINQWIFKLRDLLGDSQEIETKSKTPTANEYSKSGILIRACEYIRTIKEENQSLQECLKEYENLHLENAQLKEEIMKLRKENERLKVLSQKNIKLEDNDSNFETS